MALASPPLWGIGQYRVGDAQFPLPYGFPDLEADVASAGRALDALGVRRGETILLVSLLSEAVQLKSWHLAAQAKGIRFSCSDLTPCDAYRTEMFTKQLTYKAVLGMGTDVLAGLEEAGHDPVEVCSRAELVAARPGAYELLRDGGLSPLWWLYVGPAVAVECAARAGAHVDGELWEVDDGGGEIVISNRVPRALTVERAPTGIRGTVARGPCVCGRSDARVVPA